MNILKLGFYEDLGQISDGKKVQRILRNRFEFNWRKNEKSRKCPKNAKREEHINLRIFLY